jgi:uncharacterized protein (TIGR03067 family)
MPNDVDRLQGEWLQLEYERGGVKQPLDAEAGWNPRTTFRGYEFVVTIADGTTPIKGTFTLDETKSPKWIDYTDTWGEDAGKTFLAIYTLEGDRFTFVAAEEGEPRPVSFTTKAKEVLRVNQRIR